VEDKGVYNRLAIQRGQEFWEALRICLDPSDGDWEDLDPPEPGEWLQAMLDKTPDQSFRNYVESRPNRPDRSRKVIYLLPICEARDLEGAAFPQGPWPSWHVLQAATERFFAPLTVRALPAMPMKELGLRIQSRKGSWGVEQYHAGMALDALEPHVPADAYGLMAVTMHDLYPKPEWNFVYGLARLTKRVGIFSFCRHTPGPAPEAWRGAQLLHRSLKTLLHEIGHMFGLKHCTWYNCLMRGSNGEQVEHQLNHLYLCPACLRKLHWNIGFDIRERYTGILEVFSEYEKAHENFAHDCAFLQRRLAKMEGIPPGSTMISELQGGPRGLALTTAPQPLSIRDSGKYVRKEVGRPRAKSTTAMVRSRSRPTSSPAHAENVSRDVHTPECPCCNPRGKDRFLGGRRSFDAESARKLLEQIECK
jgi:archaemetzincin